MADELFALTLHAPPPSEADYDAIYAAVMESERGRRFLAEYARRNRHADTQLLLGAIDRIAVALRLQSTLIEPEPEPPAVSEKLTGADISAMSKPPSPRAQVAALIETIAKARAVLDAIEPADTGMGRVTDFDSAARLLRDLENRFHAMMERTGKPGAEKRAQAAPAKPAADVAKKARAQAEKAAASSEPAPGKRKSSLPASPGKSGSRGPALRFAGKPEAGTETRDRSVLTDWKPEALAPLEADMPPQVSDKIAAPAIAEDDFNVAAFLFGTDSEPASPPPAPAITAREPAPPPAPAITMAEPAAQPEPPTPSPRKAMPADAALSKPAQEMPVSSGPVAGPADFLFAPWPHEPTPSPQPKAAGNDSAAVASKTEALLQLAERFKFDLAPDKKTPGKLKSEKLIADIAQAPPGAKHTVPSFREDALAAINALSDEEKIALFS